jgi:cytochrome c553
MVAPSPYRALYLACTYRNPPSDLTDCTITKKSIVAYWYPNMYPPMPKIVQYGNKDTQVRACGSCHLPTGTGHDESAYMAGLPASYFIRQMADWKSGDRK